MAFRVEVQTDETGEMTKDDRRYPLSLAKCMECVWSKILPTVRLSDLRKAAKKHTEETNHATYIDRTPATI